MATAVANGNITQCRFVKIDPTGVGGGTAGQVLVLQCSATTDVIYGVSGKGVNQAAYPGLDSTYLAIAGEELLVQTFDTWPNNPVLLEIGSGGCVPGDSLTSDANGAATVTTTTGVWVGAVARQKASSGDRAMVQLISPRPY